MVGVLSRAGVAALVSVLLVDGAFNSPEALVRQYSQGPYGDPTSPKYRTNVAWTLLLVTVFVGCVVAYTAIRLCLRRLQGMQPSPKPKCVGIMGVSVAAACALGALVAVGFVGEYYGEYVGSIDRMNEVGDDIGRWATMASTANRAQNTSITTATATALQYVSLLTTTEPITASDQARLGVSNSSQCATTDAVDEATVRAALASIAAAVGSVAQGQLIADALTINDETDAVSDTLKIRSAVTLYFVIPAALIATLASGYLLLRKLWWYPVSDLKARPLLHESSLRMWFSLAIISVVAVWAVTVDFQLVTTINADACKDFEQTVAVVVGHDTPGLTYYTYCAPQTAEAIFGPQATEPAICGDLPDFADQDGTACVDYNNADNAWCTIDGTEGTGWDFGWGNLSDFADPRTNLSVTQACCGCGGGFVGGTTSLAASPVPVDFVPADLLALVEIERTVAQLKINVSLTTFNCTYSPRYQLSINGYVDALNVVGNATADAIAATSCSTLDTSMNELEQAVCGSKGLIVGQATYFECLCGLATALSVAYLLWNVFPIPGQEKEDDDFLGHSSRAPQVSLKNKSHKGPQAITTNPTFDAGFAPSTITQGTVASLAGLGSRYAWPEEYEPDHWD
eukprot:m.6348 g.6348  ORF g.6348 m.6348 type:complete len:627 (+) comp3824_c0_seq1:136-2016(+)